MPQPPCSRVFSMRWYDALGVVTVLHGSDEIAGLGATDLTMQDDMLFRHDRHQPLIFHLLAP